MEYPFFCGNCRCDCKAAHIDHIYKEGTWLTADELKVLVNRKAALFLQPELEQWRIMDSLLE